MLPCRGPTHGWRGERLRGLRLLYHMTLYQRGLSIQLGLLIGRRLLRPIRIRGMLYVGIRRMLVVG